jgi:hypothetical protein
MATMGLLLDEPYRYQRYWYDSHIEKTPFV